MTAFVIGIERAPLLMLKPALATAISWGLVKTQRRCLLRTTARRTEDRVTVRRALNHAASARRAPRPRPVAQQLIARYCRFPNFDDKVIRL